MLTQVWVAAFSLLITGLGILPCSAQGALGTPADASTSAAPGLFGPRKAPAPITYPGTGVGAVLPNRPPQIIYPGTGVSAIPPDWSTIVYPGTGVGASAAPASGVSTTAAGSNSGSWIYYPGAGAVLPNRPPQVVSAGTGAIRPDWPMIVLPGTGVGASAAPASGVSTTAPGSNSGSWIYYPGAGAVLPNTPSQIIYPVIPLPSPNLSASQLIGETANSPIHDLVEPDPDLSSGVSPMNFLDLDSGLRDCDITFEQLTEKSPFCPQGAELKDGRYCQRFSFSQFPEVVRLVVRAANQSREICSGTMITPDWMLTAAHCFLGERAAADYTDSADKDYVWTPGASNQLFVNATISANNAKLAVPRYRSATRVVVYGKYSGRYSTPQFADDIALVQLDSPFPAFAVQPAALASEKDFKKETTIAGYGYSNVNGATLGEFQLTWPTRADKDSGEIAFSPQEGGDAKGGFCQGDSGGSVFVGRLRGCKPYDLAAEIRPHVLQGSISFNFLGKEDASAVTPAQKASSACIHASKMVMQDITVDARRRWICRTAGYSPVGCK
jgi:hypothetical protein